MTRMAAAAAISGLAAFGVWLFFNPATPPLRAPLEAPMAEIDGQVGVYRDAEGGEYLLAPALEGGLRLYSVSRWASSLRFDETGAAIGGEDGPALQFTEAGLQALHEGEMLLEAERVAPQAYALREVSVDNGARLAGWQFDPDADRNVGVVILHGSGDSDRGLTWYPFLAHRLAMEGIMVVLPDKRGSGRSEGDWRDASFETLAEDGAAWLAELRRAHSNYRLGFVGVSQGGSIAPLAARLAGADFAVALSSAGVPMRQQLHAEISNDVRAAGAPGLLNPLLTAAYAARARGRYPEFWRLNGDYDMLAEWRRWGGPFFLALGREDEQDNVPVADTIARLQSEFEAAENLRWAVYEGVGHSLTGEDDRFSEAFLADLTAFLIE
ncbi:MAG: hypothetical protein Tsb0010_11020 [Parvularculaceae bacterium]